MVRFADGTEVIFVDDKIVHWEQLIRTAKGTHIRVAGAANKVPTKVVQPTPKPEPTEPTVSATDVTLREIKRTPIPKLVANPKREKASALSVLLGLGVAACSFRLYFAGWTNFLESLHFRPPGGVGPFLEIFWWEEHLGLVKCAAWILSSTAVGIFYYLHFT